MSCDLTRKYQSWNWVKVLTIEKDTEPDIIFSCVSSSIIWIFTERGTDGVTLSSLRFSVPMCGDEGYGVGIWRYGEMEKWRYGDVAIWICGDMEIWK